MAGSAATDRDRRPRPPARWRRWAAAWPAAVLAGLAAPAGAWASGDGATVGADPGELAAALARQLPVAGSRAPATLVAESTRFLAAESALSLGMTHEALAELAGLADRLPEVADLIWAHTAVARRATGDWAGARAAWQQVLKLSRSPVLRAQALYGSADSDFARDLWAGAWGGYQAALAQPALAGSRAGARYNMALIAQARGDVGFAAKTFAELAFRGRDGELATLAEAALVGLGHQAPSGRSGWLQRLERLDRLIRLRRFEPAEVELAQLARSAEREDDRLLVRWRRGQLALRRGDGRRAARELEPLIRKLPAPLRLAAARDWAQALAVDGRAQAAVAALAQLGQKEARSAEGRDAWIRAAQIAQEEGNFALANRHFLAFLRRFPHDRQAEDARWRAAWTAYRGGDWARAGQLLVDAERVASARPLRERARYWQGRLAMQRGQLAEAEGLLRPLADNPGLYYGLWARARLEEMAASAGGSSREVVMVRAGAAPALPTPPSLDAQLVRPLANLQIGREAAARVQALLIMRQHDELARTILSLPARPGSARNEVAMARAQLAELTGNLTTAYRLVSVTFAEVLARGQVPAAQEVFTLAFPAVRPALVGQAAVRAKIPRSLIWALMRQESSFDEYAHSGAEAHGLMQIIPATGRRIAQALGHSDFTAADLLQPTINIPFGAWYLAQLLERYGGQVVLAAASYNAGPRAVDAWVRGRAPLATDAFVEDIPYRETRLYVRNVLTNLTAYHGLYDAGVLSVPAVVRAPVHPGRRGVDF